jgi:hypothetical protein
VLVVCGILLTISTINAQGINPPFDVNQTIEKVYEYRNLKNSREGEFLMDTSVIYTPAIEEQIYPSVAFDGTNYFIVWHDRRFNNHIYGARINQSGVLIDSAGIHISLSTYDNRDPSVAFDGINYLVVWAGRGYADRLDIYGARVDQFGIVLDSFPIYISTAERDQESSSVSFDGENYMVVWEDYRNGGDRDIYGARVNRFGRVLDTLGIPISTIGRYESWPEIAFDGVNYLVVWQDCRNGVLNDDIYGARVNQSGIVLDTVGIPISTLDSIDEIHPSVAFDGTNYFVVWADDRVDSTHEDIYGTRVSPSGCVLDTAGIAITSDLNSEHLPSIIFGGSNYLVVWKDTRNDSFTTCIFGTRVTPSGIVLDSMGIFISANRVEIETNSKPVISYDGMNYLVVWSDCRNYYNSFAVDISCSRISQTGVVIDTSGILVSSFANWQYYSAISFDSTNYMVVWSDYRSGFLDIYGTQVNPTGTLLHPAGFSISTASNHQKWPAITFDGTNYLVVWVDNREDSIYGDIYGARVSQSGITLDTSGIPISTENYFESYPSLAFGDTNYLVAWSDYRSGATFPRIYGVRISRTGIILDSSAIVISNPPFPQLGSTVSFDDTNYFVVWEDHRNDPGNLTNRDIYGTRVNQLGIVLDTSGIPISTASNNQALPAIDFDGTNYFVAWNDWRNDPGNCNNCDIYGARISRAGIVLDPSGIAIATGPCDQRAPSVAFNGTDYIVVWYHQIGFEVNLHGAKVTPSGLVIDSFVVTELPGVQYLPMLAHGPGDQFLITWSGWTDSINAHPANTFRIWGKFYPFPGVEEDAGFRIHNTGFSLNVYPNPIQKECCIKYNLPREAKVAISIYDVTGRLVKNIINEKQIAGKYSRVFDMTDLAQRVYFIRLKTKDQAETKKVVFVK